jgi:hypothetical protein
MFFVKSFKGLPSLGMRRGTGLTERYTIRKALASSQSSELRTGDASVIAERLSVDGFDEAPVPRFQVPAERNPVPIPGDTGLPDACPVVSLE